MKEWTLMFYFACDNTLAPLVVSQLKAIKDAGFHENVDVLVHFDPNELGVPTRICDVNRKRKRNPELPNTMIGDGKDPFVRNMKEDCIEPDKIKTEGRPASAALSRRLMTPDATNAQTALEDFLGFCRESHQAKRYMLFILGHGMVVGNDAFLPDDHPVSAITLKRLGTILKDFTDNVKKENGALELLGLHSCSMSAVEVAYELKGTASFMIASEGPSFVGSFPYRQLLKKTFDHLEKAKDDARRKAKTVEGGDQAQAVEDTHIDIPELVESLYFLTLFNATDFMFAGYSLDLALCSLDPQKFGGLTKSIQELVTQLKDGLAESSDKPGKSATEPGKRMKELVLLAHLEAQSYWGESYTDLYDFCRCLRKKCYPADPLYTACDNVMKQVDTIEPKEKSDKSKERSERFEALVIRSDNFGATFKYSHGLSIYFPWSKPIETVPTPRKETKTPVAGKHEVEEKGILERYKAYTFTTDLGEKSSWVSFLESYWDETRRQTRKAEDAKDGKTVVSRPEDLASADFIFNPFGVLSDDPRKPIGPMGADCSCPSIKNYPQGQGPEGKEPKQVQGKARKNLQAVSMTDGVTLAFQPLEIRDAEPDD